MTPTLKSDRIEIRCPPVLKADAQAAADAQERSLSDWVLEAIRDRIARDRRRQERRKPT